MTRFTAIAGVAALLVLGTVLPARGFDILRARSKVEIVDSASARSPLLLRFRTEVPPDPVLPLGGADGTDIRATWHQVGAVDPVQFVVLVPAGCFEANKVGLHVRDFRACGVKVERGFRELPLVDFDARLVLRRDGSCRFDLQAIFSATPEDPAPAILGTLGGAAVTVAIGDEAGTALPVAAGTVGGVTPDPF